MLWEDRRRRQLMAPTLDVLCIGAHRSVCDWLQQCELSSTVGANGLHKMKSDDTCYPGTPNVMWWWTECGTETIVLREFLIRWKFPQQEQAILFSAATRWPKFLTTFVICCVQVSSRFFLSLKTTNILISIEPSILERNTKWSRNICTFLGGVHITWSVWWMFAIRQPAAEKCCA